MDIQVSLPLDSDGFLRRECPACRQQFKWHHGPATEEAEAEPDPMSYYCPLCGEPSAMDTWWTEEQLEFIQGHAVPNAMRTVQDELAAAFRNNKFIKFAAGNDSQFPDFPVSLTEPDDMGIIASPCHPYEPVKVPEIIPGPFHCLICGQDYTV